MLGHSVRDMSEVPTPEPEASTDSAAQNERSPSAGVSHAHDRYFRAAMQGRAEQAALISSVFPGLAPLLDPGSVAPLDGTFVDEDLTQRQTDLALRARLEGRDVIVYVLIEHQRTVDPLMAVRMMRYQSRIWDRYVHEHPGTTTVPIILSAVVYQGKRPWTAPTDLRDVLDLDSATAAAVAEYLPRLCYRLDDLTQVDVETLRGRALTPPLRLMLLLLMQAPDNPDVVRLLESLRSDITDVAAGHSGPRQLRAAFTYIVNVTDIPTRQLEPFAHRLGPVVQEALMTTAEKLRAEGRAQGQAELLLELLTLRFGPQGADVEARVRAGSSGQLHVWGRRILTASTVADVLD